MAQTSVTNAPAIAFEGMVQSPATFPNTIGSHPAYGSIYYGKAVSLYSDAEVTLGSQRVKLPTSGNLGRATKVAGTAPYNINAGQTVILDVDNVGGATATFDAAAATIVDTTSYPCADQDTLAFTLTITGGEWDGVVQTITFSGATTTAAQVAAAINAQCVGLKAVAAAQVTVTTDGQGTDYDLTFAAGTSGLTFAASTAGTGDVGDINSVSALEFKTVLEADTTADVAVSGNVPTITSPTTGSGSELDFTGGTALTGFGLTVEVITAPAAGDLAPTNFKGVAIADTTRESTSAAYGEYVVYDSVPVMKKGRIWVVSADTVDDISKGVYVRFQNGSSSPPANTLGSFRATTHADYQLMGDNVRWVAGTTIGGVYYGLLELNLDI